MWWYLEKIQSCTFALINNFEILQVSIAFFSDAVWPRNLKFFLYINPNGYSMETKFHVPRSHSFRENCDDNLKLASHFSPILCDRGSWNFFCILTRMDTLCKPNFLFLGHKLFEKNAMLTWNYHRIFLRYCANEEREIFLYINAYGYSMQNKFHVPQSHSFREKCDDNLKKFKVAHSP